jgi:hypothetical protein
VTDELTPEGWGKALIEDLLFRAGRDVAAAAAPRDGVELTLQIRVIPEPEGNAVCLVTAGAVEPEIATRITL